MEVVSTARPPLALHCSDSLAFVRFAVQEKAQAGLVRFFQGRPSGDGEEDNLVYHYPKVVQERIETDR